MSRELTIINDSDESSNSSNFINHKYLKISTITMTAESNINYDLNGIINSDFVNHEYLKNKVIFSKESEYKNFLKNIFEYGTILFLKYMDKYKGYKYHKPKKRFKKKNIENDFINQISVDIISRNNLKISAMVFRNGNIKLAGCKNIDDVLVLIEIDKFFKKFKKNIDNNSQRFIDLYKNKCESEIDKNKTIILISQNMINATYYFDYEINKKILNKLINQMDNSKFNCSFEPTGQQCVKLEITDVSKKKYHILKISNEDYNYEMHEIIDKDVKNTTSFTIFSLSCIISGSNYQSINNSFMIFKSIIDEYKHELKIDN